MLETNEKKSLIKEIEDIEKRQKETLELKNRVIKIKMNELNNKM